MWPLGVESQWVFLLALESPLLWAQVSVSEARSLPSAKAPVSSSVLGLVESLASIALLRRWEDSVALLAQPAKRLMWAPPTTGAVDCLSPDRTQSTKLTPARW